MAAIHTGIKSTQEASKLASQIADENGTPVIVICLNGGFAIYRQDDPDFEIHQPAYYTIVQPRKQPHLIDFWTEDFQRESEREGWQLLASGNSGGKWAICSIGEQSDAEITSLVVKRARVSKRHWLAAVLAGLLSAMPEGK